MYDGKALLYKYQDSLSKHVYCAGVGVVAVRI